MFLLLFVSGVPFAEGANLARYHKTKEQGEEFDADFERTAPIIPFPPPLYYHLPHWVKLGFCCEFPMYQYRPKEAAAAAAAPLLLPL